MNETEKLARELFEMVDIRPWEEISKGHYENWLRLAKHVQKLLIEAEIKGLNFKTDESTYFENQRTERIEILTKIKESIG